MSVSYQTLKAMSEEDLVDRYDEQAGWTAESLELYAEELRHREICRLLKSIRADSVRSGEPGVGMIDELCSSLLELLEAPSPEAKKRAKVLHDRARRFLESEGHESQSLSD